jgi:hypothetical protein
VDDVTDRVNVPPLLPVIVFPVLSIVNVIFKGPFGVEYTSFPDVVDPPAKVPVTAVHPLAVVVGVRTQVFPVCTIFPIFHVPVRFGEETVVL